MKSIFKKEHSQSIPAGEVIDHLNYLFPRKRALICTYKQGSPHFHDAQT